MGENDLKKQLYRDLEYWKKYHDFLPENMRFNEDNYPEEDWWEWKGNSIHLDHIRKPSAKVKFILLHGGGGNGRLLSTYGVLLHRHGYEYVAPDLPGFGLTVASPEYRKKYSAWVDIISDLIDIERKRDSRPIVLFGGSIGGMLAYHAACKNRNIRGIVATCLADSRMPVIRDALAKNKLWSRTGYSLNSILRFMTGKLNIRASWISNMKHITNDPEFSKVFINDPFVGKSKINLEFYMSMTEYDPIIEPEQFKVCPVLLVHPEKDKWTPFEISKMFYDRIAGRKKYILLKGAGHYPYQEHSLKQMMESVEDLVKEIDLY